MRTAEFPDLPRPRRPTIVVLVGRPDYYPRFGFSAGKTKNPSSRYPGEAFMAPELAPGALFGVSGRFAFAPPFEAVS